MTTDVRDAVGVTAVACVLDVAGDLAAVGVPSVTGFPAVVVVPAAAISVDTSAKCLPVSLTKVKKCALDIFGRCQWPNNFGMVVDNYAIANLSHSEKRDLR